LQMSSVVLGFDGPVREAAVPPGALKNLLPFQPTTTRVFQRDDTLRVFAPMFWESADQSVEVTIHVDGLAEALSQTETVAASSGAGRRRQAAINTTLPVGPLAPGSYILDVTARLQSGKSAHREVAFEIK